MRLLLLFLSFILVDLCPAAAQSTNLFIRFYGAPFSNSGNYAYDVVQTHDHGYAFTGVTLTTSGTQVNGHLMLYKADERGKLLWSREINLSGFSSSPCADANGYAITEMADSSLVIAATCGYSLNLVRTTSSGSIIWIHDFSSYRVGNEIDVNMCRTSDGGVAICGTDGQDARLLKFNASGLLDWTKTYGHAGGLRTADLKLTADSGFLLACTGGPNYDSAHIIRTNALGNEIWARSWNSTGGGFYVTGLTPASDGGCLFTGGSAISGGFVCKLSSTGTESWWLPTPGYISYGVYEDTGRAWYSFSWATGYLMGFQKIALNGASVLWSRTFGQATPQYAGDFAHTVDGGFILCGYGRSDSAGVSGTSAILMKTDTAGNMVLPSTGIAGGALQSAQLVLYPNPATQILGFDNPLGGDGKITISDAAGRPVRAMPAGRRRHIQVDISGLAPGLYFLMLAGDGGLPMYYGQYIRQ